MRVFAFTAACAALLATGCVVGIDPPEPTEKVLISGGDFPFGSTFMCFNANQDELECDAPTLTNLPKTYPIAVVNLKPFLVDAHEVTNAQYDYCVQMGNCQLPQYDNIQNGEIYYGVPLYEDHPVVNVTQEMAATYCEFMGGRLPNEVEWERVAGGPSTGATPKRIVPTDRINYSKIRTCGTKAAGIAVMFCTADPRPSAVMESVDDYVTENGVKIYDLAGNVSEWTDGVYRDGVTCAEELPVDCDCWSCSTRFGDDGEQQLLQDCKENCYTTCTTCKTNENCFVQCEDPVSKLGLPVCIAYQGTVEIDSLVLKSSVGERVVKGGNYATTNTKTCEITVSNRTRHSGVASFSPTIGFRCVYDPESDASAE